MVMETLTSLGSRNEIYHWDNRPFTSSWPEHINTIYRGGEITRAIKKKPKRNRTSFTTNQINLLEEYFSKQTFIGPKDRLQLSKVVGIGEKQIKVWFQNRRMKEKKKILEMSESLSEITSPSPSSTNQSEHESSVDSNGPSYTENGYEAGNSYDYQLPTPSFNTSSHHDEILADFFDVHSTNYHSEAPIYHNFYQSFSNIANANVVYPNPYFVTCQAYDPYYNSYNNSNFYEQAPNYSNWN